MPALLAATASNTPPEPDRICSVALAPETGRPDLSTTVPLGSMLAPNVELSDLSSSLVMTRSPMYIAIPSGPATSNSDPNCDSSAPDGPLTNWYPVAAVMRGSARPAREPATLAGVPAPRPARNCRSETPSQ